MEKKYMPMNCIMKHKRMGQSRLSRRETMFFTVFVHRKACYCLLNHGLCGAVNHNNLLNDRYTYKLTKS